MKHQENKPLGSQSSPSNSLSLAPRSGRFSISCKALCCCVFVVGAILHILLTTILLFGVENYHKADPVQIYEVFETPKYALTNELLDNTRYLILHGEPQSGIINFIEHEANLRVIEGKPVVIRQLEENFIKKHMKETKHFVEMYLGQVGRGHHSWFIVLNDTETPTHQIQALQKKYPHDSIVLISHKKLEIDGFATHKFPALKLKQLKDFMEKDLDMDKKEIKQILAQAGSKDAPQIFQAYKSHEEAKTKAAEETEILKRQQQQEQRQKDEEERIRLEQALKEETQAIQQQQTQEEEPKKKSTKKSKSKTQKARKAKVTEPKEQQVEQEQTEQEVPEEPKESKKQKSAKKQEKSSKSKSKKNAQAIEDIEEKIEQQLEKTLQSLPEVHAQQQPIVVQVQEKESKKSKGGKSKKSKKTKEVEVESEVEKEEETKEVQMQVLIVEQLKVEIPEVIEPAIVEQANVEQQTPQPKQTKGKQGKSKKIKKGSKKSREAAKLEQVVVEAPSTEQIGQNGDFQPVEIIPSELVATTGEQKKPQQVVTIIENQF